MHGVDLLDVSSGGIHPAQKFKLGPLMQHRLMQVPFSAAVRKAHGDKLLVGAVGTITTGALAQGVLDEGAAGGAEDVDKSFCCEGCL